MPGTIGLMMIVKDEQHTLPRLAASLAGQLDHWTVVDTGSSDATPSLVPELFAGIPGQLIEDEWRGYGPSRNVALEAARPHTDWLLTLDADDLVHGDVRAALDADPALAADADPAAAADAIEAALRYAGLVYWLPRLVRSTAPWRWYGRAHEYLGTGDVPSRLARTDAFSVVHLADGGNRSGKLGRERQLLEADLAEAPDDPRTLFYLARTHEDLGASAEAARYYRRRIALDGWEEETWLSRWRLASCLLATGSHDEAAGSLLACWGDRPNRAEPLWSLAEHYRISGRWRLCWEIWRLATWHTAVRPDGRGAPPTADRLFVHEDVYQWRLAYEASVAAWYVGERPAGRRLCDYLRTQDLPPAIRDNVEENRRFYD